MGARCLEALIAEEKIEFVDLLRYRTGPIEHGQGAGVGKDC